MKKILKSVFASTIISSSALSVAACNNNNNLTLTNNIDDAIRILSISTLNTKALLDNGVRFGGNVSDEQVTEVIRFLGLEDRMQNTAIGIQLRQSFRVFIMANQLLGNISSSVPNYQWINSKLQWQSSRWGFIQLLNQSVNKGIAMNSSAWITNDNDFSLSVTFLDELRNGWKGIGEPVYARININKRISVNDIGFLNVNESNQNAIWVDPNLDINSFSAFQTIPSSTSTQTSNRGNIYQGFVNSSELIDLAGIYNPEDSSIPSSIFGFTPSVVDLVNNMFIRSNIVNKILGESRFEIEEQVNEYLLNKPIYIGENVALNDVELRLRNQIFMVLFKNVLKRREIDNKFTDEDISFADAIIPNWWARIIIVGNNTLSLSNLDEEVKNRIQEFLTNIPDYQQRDISGELSSSEINLIYDEMRYLVENSYDSNNFNSVEADITQTSFATQFGFRTVNVNSGRVGELQTISNMRNLSFFGSNNSTELEVSYYYGTLNPDLDDVENMKYRPDENKNPITSEFISDKGFKNVFYEPRVSQLLEKYASDLISNYKNGTYEEFNLRTPTLISDIFDLTKLVGETDFQLGDSSVTDDWFSRAGYLNQFNVTDRDQISIPQLADLISQNMTTNFCGVFDVNETNQQSQFGTIWDTKNGPTSFDRMIWNDSNNLIADTNTENFDDDIAFASLLNRETAFLSATDQAPNGASNLRQSIWNNGLQIQNLEMRVIFNNFNSYGVLDASSLDSNLWWQNDNLDSMTFYIVLDLRSGELNDEWENAFSAYWDRWVRQNPNNPDYNFGQ